MKRKSMMKLPMALIQAGLLSSCLLLAGCSDVEMAQDVFTSELGVDVFANPRLYVADEDSIDVDKAVISAASPGVVKSNNRFVNNGSQYLDIGDYDFIMTYKGKEYPFQIKVTDTRPPSVGRSPQSVDAAVGQTIDWDSVFAATDLSGVYYETDRLPTSDFGPQNVNVKISDRFGNAVTKNITVNVS